VTKGTADIVNTRRVGSYTSGLATFGDRLNDIRCQIAEPQNPADMSLIELELPERCCAGCEAGGASFAREGRQNSRLSFALQ